MNYDNTRNKERNSCDIHATLQPRFTQNVTTFENNNIHIHNLQKIAFAMMYLFAVWLLGWLNLQKMMPDRSPIMMGCITGSNFV